MKMKPILFNTEMVRAILEGRKTVTRRVIKPVAMGLTYEDGSPARKPQYCPGDILYVRETWCKTDCFGLQDGYVYKANDNSILEETGFAPKWRPSIHMPREAARIFLRVKDVRVERLQNITYEDCLCEGIAKEEIDERDAFRPVTSAKWLFAQLWDSTIKPADRALYGWAANPWVWVIEFERISKEEALRDAQSHRHRL